MNERLCARVQHDNPPNGTAEFDRLVASVAKRWAAVDPLLPEPSHPKLNTNPLLTVSDELGRPMAIGAMRYSWYQPGEAGRTWGVPDQHWITPLVGGSDPEGALDSLLTSWRDQLERLPTGTGSESAALLTWPARDVCGIRPLQRHGMQPVTVMAVRERRRGVPPALPPRDVTIRLADLQDLTAVVSLVMEEHRYEEHFGSIRRRPPRWRAARAEPQPPDRLMNGVAGFVWVSHRTGHGGSPPSSTRHPPPHRLRNCGREMGQGWHPTATRTTPWTPTARGHPAQLLGHNPCQARSGTGWATGRCGPWEVRPAAPCGAPHGRGPAGTHNRAEGPSPQDRVLSWEPWSPRVCSGRVVGGHRGADGGVPQPHNHGANRHPPRVANTCHRRRRSSLGKA